MDFEVMHYQIYRFCRYLLVLLSVPEIFGVKIYPNVLFVYCSQNFQHFSMPRFAKFTASFHFGRIMCRPLSKIADLRYGQMPRDSSGWAQPHIVQVNSVRQTSLNSFFSRNLSPMTVDTM